MSKRVDSHRRQCPKCNEVKPNEAFSTNRASKNGYSVYCRVCESAAGKARYAANPEPARKYNRESYYQNKEATKQRNWENRLRREFGIGPEAYLALYHKQGGVCAICGKQETRQWRANTAISRLAVDHCHKTGAVRGLLCHRCNRALGLLGDDASTMQRALSYLTTLH